MEDIAFGDLFKETYSLFEDKWKVILGIALLFSFLPNFILGIITRIIFEPLTQEGMIPTFSSMFELFAQTIPFTIVAMLFSLLGTVSILYILKMHNQNKEIGFSESVKGGSKYYWKVLLFSILITIFLSFLYLLLIIPGIIFSTYWTFSLLILFMEDAKIMESLKKSKQLVKGRWWRVFGYFLLLIIIVIIAQVIIGGIMEIIFGIFLATSSFTFITITSGVSTLLSAIISFFIIIFLERFYTSIKNSENVKTQ